MKKRNYNNIIIAIFVILTITFISSCYYDNQAELHPNLDAGNQCDSSGVMTYTKNISPIMIASCGANNSGCHQVANNTNSNVGLNSYADMFAIDTTQLMSAIVQDGNYEEMPKEGSKLPSCQIDIIQKWVNTGQQN